MCNNVLYCNVFLVFLINLVDQHRSIRNKLSVNNIINKLYNPFFVSNVGRIKNMFTKVLKNIGG